MSIGQEVKKKGSSRKNDVYEEEKQQKCLWFDYEVSEGGGKKVLSADLKRKSQNFTVIRAES